MTESMEARLLAFIEGRLTESERERLLIEVAASPELQRLLTQAQGGHRALARLSPVASNPLPAEGGGGPHRASGAITPVENSIPLIRKPVPFTWVIGAVAATFLVAIPATLAWSAAPSGVEAPTAAQNEFLVVLHGEWPDIDELSSDARQVRRGEYWAWAQELIGDDALIGAGELAPEPGTRLAGDGVSFTSGGPLERNREFVVGLFVVRAPNYDAAVMLAESSPHVRHGGSVTVRAFNTVVGFEP